MLMTHRSNSAKRPGLTVSLLLLVLAAEITVLSLRHFYGLQHWVLSPLVYSCLGIGGIIVVLQPFIDGTRR
jgi:hypothetical protein